MKRLAAIFIFIFLTGLFSGLFFSTNLSHENNNYLSVLLLSSFTVSDFTFIHAFFTSILSNFSLILLMLPSLLSRYLCPLPPLVLWYKSFAIGFCSGLVYINAADKAFLISLVKMLPQNLFIIPAFLSLSALLFTSAGTFSAHMLATHKKSRTHLQSKSLLSIVFISLALVVIGSLMEAAFHMISL